MTGMKGVKRWAALLTILIVAFSGSAACCESGTSEIEKIAGLASWLLGEAKEYQQEKREQEQALDAMFWMYDDADSAAPEDVPEIAAMLKGFGIEGITDKQIGEMINAVKEDQSYGYVCTRAMIALRLLAAVGMGTYDDDFVWHPSSDTVFALDMELFGGEALYGDFLKGLNAICREEFVFSDLAEDYGRSDLEKGTGIIGLSFLVNGEPHRIDAEMMLDWFDTRVFNAAAEIAVHAESGRRLYAVYDGMQGLIIFYNTPEWAQQFEAETGCPLYESLPVSE